MEEEPPIKAEQDEGDSRPTIDDFPETAIRTPEPDIKPSEKSPFEYGEISDKIKKGGKPGWGGGYPPGFDPDKIPIPRDKGLN